MSNNIWQLQDAKSKFSQLVERVLSNGVQIVTRHGKKAVVVMPFEDYERLTRQGNSLGAFLLTSPLVGTELDISREKSLPREIRMEP